MDSCSLPAPRPPRWMGRVLVAAGFYNIVWGAVAIFFPTLFFTAAGMEPPNYLFLWQCIGMIVGVYGVGYLAAATDPFRHWPIVLVGFLGKVFGPIGFLQALFAGEVTLAFGINIIFNDLIWWVPFALILMGAWRSYREEDTSSPPLTLAQALDEVTDKGRSLRELSHESPVLLTYLRHAGCTFCRMTIDLIAQHSEELAKRQITLAFGHMDTNEDTRALLTSWKISPTAHLLRDPERRTYRAFGLRRGSLWQLFAPRIWVTALLGIVKGYGVGPLKGDGFQMPGAFVIDRGEIIFRWQPVFADERLPMDQVTALLFRER